MKINGRNHRGSFIFLVIGILLFFTSGSFGLMGQLFSSAGSGQDTVIEDTNMTTSAYHTEIRVQEDNSYLISEDIEVNFHNERHGIYRYVPQKGMITELKEDGDILDIPYFAKFDSAKIRASVPVEVSTDNGNQVFRLGDADQTVYGNQEYHLQYEVAPVTSKGYPNAYYNIFPTGWQNEIPAGSTFSITFPKEINTDSFQIYYGRYGEKMDGNEMVRLTWSGNTLLGELIQALPVGTGMTFYVPLDEGYFTNLNTTKPYNFLVIAISGIVLIALLVLFFLFGRDRQIIPSVQFRPPKGLDSAAVGYIVDGNVSDTDIISLILYWADQGYLKIRETKKSTLAFTKTGELPEDAPNYEKTLFCGIFGKAGSVGDEILLSSLKYKTAGTFSKAKEQVMNAYSQRVYTQSSRAARAVSLVLSCVPFFLFTFCLVRYTAVNGLVFLLPVLYLIGVILFNHTVDYWYSRTRSLRLMLGSSASAMSVTSVVALILVYGTGMLRENFLNLFPGLIAAAVTSLAGVVLTGFMKKRTEECVEWMGYLAGLRDFIETAELDRLKVIAKDSPQLFYHILPFAYVFGLTDILLDKMKSITLPAPDWYETRNRNADYFDYYVMHHMLHNDMKHVAATISTPRPQQSSGSSSGSFGSGGFSGGGFSGGGFGGGGGGSW